MKKEQFGRIGDAWAGCPAVRSGDFVFYSGQMAPDVASGDVGYSVSYRSKEQTAEVFRFFESLAKEAGSSIDNVVKLQTFHVDLDDFPPQVEARRNAFTPPLPPSTAIECALPHPAADAMVSAIGVRTGTLVRTVETDEVPRPRGPYSQGIVAPPFVFLAGVLASDFVTGVAPEARVPAGLSFFGSRVERQTDFVLRTIGTILEEAGSSLEAVLKAQVFLDDMADFYEFERVWREYFPARPPARTVVQGGLVNPGCIVEVDVIALSGDAGLRREPLQAESTPQSPLAESVAVRAGDWLFFGGQLATDYKTGVAPAARIDPNFPRYETAVKRQGNYILNNVAALLEELGSSVADVVHLWGFVAGRQENFIGLRELLRERFDREHLPAVTAAGTSSACVPECVLTIDGIALVS